MDCFQDSFTAMAAEFEAKQLRHQREEFVLYDISLEIGMI